ncbi:MAG: hypothetical protein E7480_07535 [Ruminococcaceae bacterium]|nr:hypothetical protein [Oscillospiraceae bacterium]
MNKRKKRMNTVGLIIISIFLTISSLILLLYGYFLFNALFGKKISIDSEYAMYVANGDIAVKKYDIEECSALYFFEAEFSKGKRTLFTNEVPNLKIINDTEYYVEISANKEIHDVIDISLSDNVLIIECKDDIYNRVHEDDTSYDYNYGLYVDCEKLDITVHAPISRFYTDTNLTLDFDAAKADKVVAELAFGVDKGVIYNIDAKSFRLICSGSSRVELIGNVSETAEIKLWHDSRVDAKKLTASEWDTDVSRAIGGFSYISREKWGLFEFDVEGPTNILEFFIFASFILWLAIEIDLIKKRKKLLQELSIENEVKSSVQAD